MEKVLMSETTLQIQRRLQDRLAAVKHDTVALALIETLKEIERIEERLNDVMYHHGLSTGL